MPDPDVVYATLAAGGSAPPLSAQEQFLVLARAERAAGGASPDERLAGLRVAETLGGREGLRIVGLFGKDPDRVVRRAALDAALRARDEGLPILREAILDADTGLAVEALRRLTLAGDKASTSRARTALRAPSGVVRAAAAGLLGQVAGSAVRPELLGLAVDTDPAVRAAAEQALAQVEGRADRPPPSAWWEPLPEVAISTDSEPKKATEVPAPSPESASTSLTEALALLRCAGTEDPPSEPLLSSLRGMDPATLLAAGQEYKAGSDTALGRGFAHAARMLERTEWSSTLRRLTVDSDPSVQAAAVAALGGLGRGLAALHLLEPFLRHEVPLVRKAAAQGLDAVCTRLGRRELLLERLRPLTEDSDPQVRSAARRALGMEVA
jgi:HEAT repeat protein